jgi:hypothetical protein
LDREQIHDNTFRSFDTLKYILEISFGGLVNDIQYSITPGINDEGLVDLEGDMYFEMSCPEPDITSVSLRLKKLDSLLNDVLNTYFFTDQGNLIKHKPQTTLMGVATMLSKIDYDPIEENMKIIINIIFYDV